MLNSDNVSRDSTCPGQRPERTLGRSPLIVLRLAGCAINKSESFSEASAGTALKRYKAGDVNGVLSPIAVCPIRPSRRGAGQSRTTFWVAPISNCRAHVS